MKPTEIRRRRLSFNWVALPVLVMVLCALGAVLYLTWMGFSNPFKQLKEVFLPPPPFGGKPQVNILMVGVDNTKGSLADSIILVAVDWPGKRVDLLSIPRDLRVEIPGYKPQKINSSHALGGIALTKQTVEDLLGVPLDYYCTITSSGLVRIVDALGGVTINVEKRMHYVDRSQKLYIDLQPGRQRLSGEQAMGYVRFRHDRLGDISRMRRQQEFLRAVAAELVANSQTGRALKFADIFKRNVHTDLDLADIRAMKDLGRQMNLSHLQAATLPTLPVTIRRISYLEPDTEAIPRVVAQVVNHRMARVEVLNGTDVVGLATKAKQQIEQAGYQVVETGNAPKPADATLVIDHEGREETAREIAELVYCRQVQADHRPSQKADVTVVLGRDYAEVVR